MALQDFIQKLKEQDDSNVIYSKTPDDVIRVIPPEKPSKPVDVIKIVPPKEEKVIKFKLNVKKIEPVLQQPKEEKPNGESKPKEVDPIELLFRKSGTASNKREIWYDYYKQAKASKKQNSVAERMRQGKFAITADNQVLILPDFDISGKSSSKIMGEKWIRN